jgi:glycyl-tRNA synthetase beta chain
VAVGTFDEGFLAVPREILEDAMESHQRYFPLQDAAGALTNRFVVVHNGDPLRTDAIVSGHERVIRARLADAAFFYHEDIKQPLESYAEKLEAIVFQERLGTMGAKVERIAALSGIIAEKLAAPGDVRAWAVRAAQLAKADLVTQAVVEFTDLQGVMGRYYAIESGEATEVAVAIEEHYRPRFAGDAPPASAAGTIVSIADKVDTIVGIFAAGLAPKGSADPYALRRASIGVLTMLVEHRLELGLSELVDAALAGYEGVVKGLDRAAVGAAVHEFMLTRFAGMLKERGHRYDTVEAVLAVAGDRPLDAMARAEALTPFRGSEAIENLATAFTRAKNLAKPELGTATDVGIMGEHERALDEALTAADADVTAAIDESLYTAALDRLAGLRGPIDDFFTNVLVMDQDERVRDNRLRLLNRFVGLFERFADFSKLAE